MIDIHTHHFGMGRNAIYSLLPSSGFIPSRDTYYSAGIHPWYVRQFLLGELGTYDELEALCRQPEVLAVGEAGLDKVFLSSFASETGRLWKQSVEIFECQAHFSEIIGKPMILHCVRAVDELLGIHRAIRPCQQWIIHGFRGKPQQAEQLLKHGFALSLGEKFNPQTAQIIPVEALFIETDESACSIREILFRVAVARNEEAETLSARLRENVCRAFHLE